MREELLKGLTEDQIIKVRACGNRRDLLQLAKDEGVDLTAEQLEAVTGGCGTVETPKCPRCLAEHPVDLGAGRYKCNKCQYEWTIDNLY